MTKEIALVTGSTSGIGAATADVFAAHGYHVVITGRDKERGMALRQRLAERGDSADFYAADLTDQVSAVKVVEDAAKLGVLAVLVNCIGGNKPTMSDKQLMDTNFWAARYVMDAALERMKSGAHIIGVTSICSEVASAHEGGMYSEAKIALTGYMHEQVAAQAARGIRINIIAPGLTHTPDTAHIPAQDRRAIVADMPFAESFLSPYDVANAIYDSANAWRYSTGQTTIVDGGLTAGEN